MVGHQAGAKLPSMEIFDGPKSALSSKRLTMKVGNLDHREFLTEEGDLRPVQIHQRLTPYSTKKSGRTLERLDYSMIEEGRYKRCFGWLPGILVKRSFGNSRPWLGTGGLNSVRVQLLILMDHQKVKAGRGDI